MGVAFDEREYAILIAYIVGYNQIFWYKRMIFSL